MIYRRAGRISESAGAAAGIAFIIAFLFLQVMSIHGLAVWLDIGYVAAFFIVIVGAAIIPFSEVLLVILGLYGTYLLVWG